MSALATSIAPASDLSIWQRMRVWAAAHATADLYQGLVPAAVPYFVLERNLSYSAASGLALAATFGSALPQLPIGMLADRRRVPWLGPLGLILAAVGVGLAGVFAPYPLVFAMLLLSGLGVAMFHPPAGRDARVAAAHSASAMSVFAAGGSVGFFLAPALATPLLDGIGLGALVLFIPPAVLMAFVLSRHQSRQVAQLTTAGADAGTDRPRMFALLIAVEVARSCISFGINTFVALYWIKELGASSALGGTALTLGLLGGIAGTLLGGRIGDRFGLTRTIQLGNAALIPAFGALLLVRDPHVALVFVTLLGLTANIPLAVLVKLGQDYLPSRPGTAAGVTLGLAVSAGGLFQPVLGFIADHHGPHGAFVTLAFMPLLAIALSAGLKPPETR